MASLSTGQSYLNCTNGAVTFEMAAIHTMLIGFIHIRLVKVHVLDFYVKMDYFSYEILKKRGLDHH